MIVRVGNMYCEDSKKNVKEAIESIGLQASEINQGVIIFAEEQDDEMLSELDMLIRKHGMALLTDSVDIMTDNVKMHAWNYIHFPDDPVMKFSVYLERKLGYKYNYLSNVFSAAEGQSITAFLNQQKIKAVQTLIAKGHSFSDIARVLNYANLSHLSYVYKKTTGLTLSQYRQAAANEAEYQ